MSDEKESSLFKRMLSISVGALFLTEESLRGLLKDVKLPKELLGTVLESAQKTKSEFFDRFSRDILDRLKGQVDPKALIQEILERNTIDVKMSIQFKRREKE